MKLNTSNCSNICMRLRRAGLSAWAGLSCWIFMLKIFGGPHSSLGCVLDILDQSLVCVKICQAAHPKGRNLISWKSPLGWVNTWENITFLLVDQSLPIFLFNKGGVCSWSSAFPIFAMRIRCRDICDQSGKLWKIAPNFWTFLPSQILLGQPFQN